MIFIRQSTIPPLHGWYGASGVNCSLIVWNRRAYRQYASGSHGIFEYAQLQGLLDGMDTTVITELAEYYEKNWDTRVAATAVCRKKFNVTRAGIHADGWSF